MNGDLFPEVAPTPDENRRYTTRQLMEYAKRVAGVTAWDLDPDADLESHHAPRYFVAPGDVRVYATRGPAVAHEGCSYIAAALGSTCTKCGRVMPSGVDSLAQSWLPPAPLNEWRDARLEVDEDGDCVRCGLSVGDDQHLCPPGFSMPGRENRWRIFNNPPFDAIGPRIEKVWKTIEQSCDTWRCAKCECAFIAESPKHCISGNCDGWLVRPLALVVAMVMPGNRGEQPFWQEHVEPYLEGHEKAGRYGYALTVHHPPGRQAYGYPGNPLGIGSAASTPWPTIVLHWRRR